jgi:hypothetical protein
MAYEGNRKRPAAETSQCIDWYAEGQARMVEVGDVRITIRLVGRKGRRAPDRHYGASRGGVSRC